MDKVSFGKRLNNVRKEKQITSDALSEKIGVNPVFIRQIESAAKLPSLPNFVKLCNALDVSPDYLLANSLTTNEQDQFNNLSKKLRTLTPKQQGLVSAMVDTLINKLEE